MEPIKLGLSLGLGLGLDEGGEAFPEARGADTDGAGEVAKVLLAPHLKHLLSEPTIQFEHEMLVQVGMRRNLRLCGHF